MIQNKRLRPLCTGNEAFLHYVLCEQGFCSLFLVRWFEYKDFLSLRWFCTCEHAEFLCLWAVYVFYSIKIGGGWGGYFLKKFQFFLTVSCHVRFLFEVDTFWWPHFTNIVGYRVSNKTVFFFLAIDL